MILYSIPATNMKMATRLVRFIKRMLKRVDLLRGFTSFSMCTKISDEVFKHTFSLLGLYSEKNMDQTESIDYETWLLVLSHWLAEVQVSNAEIDKEALSELQSEAYEEIFSTLSKNTWF
jgi:hypothetical protein